MKITLPVQPTTVLSNQRGAVLVENIFTLSLLFFMVIGLIDVVRISFQVLVAQYAVSDAARWGAIGTAASGLTREKSIEQRFAATMRSLGVSPNTEYLMIFPESMPHCPVHNAGNANEVFVVSYSNPIKLYTLKTRLEVLAGAYARNEPF